MSTVYGIVKQNSDFINAYSEPGHGTTFKIYFPRHIGPVGLKQEVQVEAVRGGSETVLLVEDEVQIEQGRGRSSFDAINHDKPATSEDADHSPL